MITNYHMCICIEGALRQPRLLKYWTDDDGNPQKPAAVREFLRCELAKGRKVLPMGECDNFDYQSGCKGHPQEESVK